MKLKNCIVMGSGRSGTSLLTSLLTREEYFFGNDLLKPTESNPYGYFEDRNINKINDDLIKMVIRNRPRFLGRYFFKNLPIDGQRWLSLVELGVTFPEDNFISEQIASLVKKTPYCFKDPRMCYTLPYWRPYLDNVVFLCVFRDPLVTVNSMISFNKQSGDYYSFPLKGEHAIKVWQKMYHHILREHRKEGDWLFVHYNQILDGTALDEISKLTGAQLNTSMINRTFNKSLPKDLDLDSDVRETYSQLCRLANYQCA